MLNRLYIVLGSLLILLIAFGFIAPYFIDWSDRRPQIEALASEALGTPVAISGKIDIHLLPAPRVTMDGISVGPVGSPVATIRHAEADFSLTDFLRDRFAITRLGVTGIALSLSVDEAGKLFLPINLPESVNASNISVANAEFTESAVTLSDARSGGEWRMDELEGKLSLSALRGPFGVNATGNFDGKSYQVRINTSQMGADSGVQVALFLRALDGSFSLNTDGLLTTGDSPGYTGKLSYRQPPPENGETVSGNLVLDAQVDANPERARMTSYVLVPDENRAGTRLTGEAELVLGAATRFKVNISGGVVGLAPRDARMTSENDPYELVRLISELPPAPVPPLPGEIHVDIAELDLRAFAMRNVRLDARTDGEDWRIDTLRGNLSGDTTLAFRGTLGQQDDKLAANGQLRIDTSRLDALVQLWRAPDEETPLFGITANLDTGIALSDGVVSLTDGKGRLDGASFTFAGQVPASGGTLGVTAALGEFDRVQSRELMASLPDIAGDPRFVASFSGAEFDLSAESLDVFGLVGSRLAVRGAWTPEGLSFSQLAAGEWGGASFTLSGAFKAGKQPILTGSGRLILDADADQGALPVVYSSLGVSPEIRALVDRNLPASLDIALAAPDDSSAQELKVSGRAGVADMTFGAKVSQGILNYERGPIGVRVMLSSDSPAGLAAALGIDAGLDATGAATATLVAEGSPVNSLDTELLFDSPGNRLKYAGSMILNDLKAVQGRGKLDFDLAEPAAWADVLGVAGLYLPPLTGVSEIAFTGTQAITLSSLNADAGGTSVRGDLVRSVEAGMPLYSGTLKLGGVELGGFPALFLGGASLLNLEGGTWPDGPFAEPDDARSTRGRVSVSADAITSNGRALAGRTDFDVIWDDRNGRIRGLAAAIGDGELSLDLSVCCVGTPGPRQVSGRLGLDSVALDALLPEVPAEAVDASLTGSMQVNGTGETIAAIIGSLTGQGSFSARDISIASFDPGAFESIAGEDTLLNLDTDQLAKLVGDSLASGPFKSGQMDGVLSLAGGTLRADNLAASSGRGDLYGSMAVDLSSLGLSGAWTLAPGGPVGDGALINETTGRIGAVLGGTITQPDHQLDLAQMVDSIQVRAYELEVDRLEKLKAEEEARARAAAEERTRLMELDAQRKVEQALAKAEAEAKAKAEAEAKAKAEAEARAQAEADAKAAAEADAKAEEEAAAKAAADQKAADDAAARAEADSEAGVAEEAAPSDGQPELTDEQRNAQILTRLIEEYGSGTEAQSPLQPDATVPCLPSIDPLVVCPPSEEAPLDLIVPADPNQPIDLNTGNSVQTLGQ